MTYGLSGNDYRVASLSNSYLTPKGIINHHAMFEIDRTILTCLNLQKRDCYGRMNGRTDPNFRIASLLKRKKVSLVLKVGLYEDILICLLLSRDFYKFILLFPEKDSLD